MPVKTMGCLDDRRWSAVLSRNAAADDEFVYAVKTTGVYCRPSSPTRLPRRENVEFFDNAEGAEAAGYRPSRRAALRDRHDRVVARPSGSRSGRALPFCVPRWPPGGALRFSVVRFSVD